MLNNTKKALSLIQELGQSTAQSLVHSTKIMLEKGGKEESLVQKEVRDLTCNYWPCLDPDSKQLVVTLFQKISEELMSSEYEMLQKALIFKSVIVSSDQYNKMFKYLY